MLSHKEWLDNEYKQWIAALQESNIGNFKEHPMVRRMLGEVDLALFQAVIGLLSNDQCRMLWRIDSVGRTRPDFVSGAFLRMAHYALKVLDKNPPSVIEIGGGVGQFYAVLRALGYRGQYMIMDLHEVMDFQKRYLQTVENLTGLSLPLKNGGYTFDFCVSFYALGEFDDETKAWYIEHVVTQCPHGLILWNPHSGASPEIPFRCTIRDEEPLTHPGNKELTW